MSVLRVLRPGLTATRYRPLTTNTHPSYGDLHTLLPPADPFPIRTQNPFRRALKPKRSHPNPVYRLCVFSSRNNTISTFTDSEGNPLSWSSAGSCGFRKSQRASYEAGYQSAVKIFRKIED